MHEHGGNRGSEGALSGPTVVLIGQPNVGKSVIFGRLTGKYAVVSNYPGTSVEVTTGQLHIGEKTFTVIDTPGINSLHPHSDDERVTRDILLERQPDVIVQVADAKNLSRALTLTSQLLECGRPLVLCLNMSDEAEQAGVHIDTRELSRLLGIEVIPTVAPEGEGLSALKRALLAPRTGTPIVAYGRQIEKGLARIGALLPEHRGCARALGLMFLAGEPGLEAWAARTYGAETLANIRAIAADASGAPGAAARDGHPEDPPRPRPDRRHPPPAPGRPRPFAPRRNPRALDARARHRLPDLHRRDARALLLRGSRSEPGCSWACSRRISSASTSTRWWCACSRWCRGPFSSGCSPVSSA